MNELKYNLTTDPHLNFSEWYKEAKEKEANHDAFSLATSGKNNRPSVRYLLLKGHDDNGYKFYTNKLSLKGRQIAENPFGEMAFYWRNWGRQIRISGKIEALDRSETKSLYERRPRESKIATHISKQGRPLESLDLLKEEYFNAKESLKDEELTLPDHWEGYRLVPDCFVFFVYGDHRLNERFHFQLIDNKWKHSLLYP